MPKGLKSKILSLKKYGCSHREIERILKRQGYFVDHTTIGRLIRRKNGTTNGAKR